MTLSQNTETNKRGSPTEMTDVSRYYGYDFGSQMSQGPTHRMLRPWPPALKGEVDLSEGAQVISGWHVLEGVMETQHLPPVALPPLVIQD